MIVQKIQYTQWTTLQFTKSTEKVKRRSIDIKQFENVKHERHTRSRYIHKDRENMGLSPWNSQLRMPAGVYFHTNEV